jgi:hypothetical protein
MAATLTFTEEAVCGLAPDTEAVQAARSLLKKKSFQQLGLSTDGTWLLARCKGSGKEPYQVSVDLADPNHPTFRCTCPSRKFPCKHGLGLLLAYALTPDQFATQEPPADLLAKREKKAAREQKKAESVVAVTPKVNQAALAKKVQAQRDGLDLLEKLLLDLVSSGQWFADTRLDKLERQAKQFSDAYLPGARFMLRRLILVGHQADISDEERMARASNLVGQLWATVQKGRNYLDGKLAGDESQAEADAVIEEVLGKAWQLTELREKGYMRSNLSLLELAFERIDDLARQERVEIGHLIDLADGAIHQAISYRPFKGMNQIPEQPSYVRPLVVAEAAVYPGFLNRRVRWEKGAEQLVDLTPDHLHKAYAAARADFKTALDAFRQQLKNPLAPRDAVVLLRCGRLGRVGDLVVLEDVVGARLATADRSKDYSSVANLARAGGMPCPEQPAVLARLFVLPASNSILAEPLAIVTPRQHLRLGL